MANIIRVGYDDDRLESPRDNTAPSYNFNHYYGGPKGAPPSASSPQGRRRRSTVVGFPEKTPVSGFGPDSPHQEKERRRSSLIRELALVQKFEPKEGDEVARSPLNPFYWVELVQNALDAVWERYGSCLTKLILLALVIIFHLHLVVSLRVNFERALNLLLITCAGWLIFFKVFFVTPIATRFGLVDFLTNAFSTISHHLHHNPVLKIAVYAVMCLALLALLLWDVFRTQEFERLTGLIGLVVLILFGMFISIKPTRVKWHTVFMGIFLQIVFGLIVLRWDFGKTKFVEFSGYIMKYLLFSKNGSDFCYSFVSSPPKICGMSPAIAFEYIQVLTLMGATVSVLYYFGILQAVLKQFAIVVQFTMGTTATESFNSCACVILGQGESAMLIRPYLDKMTASELHAVLTTGFACIAGVVFALFISYGACPGYLISGAIMAGPASLAISKLVYPETEESHCVNMEDLELPPSEEKTPLEAVVVGCELGAQVIISVVGNLVCFIAIQAILDFFVAFYLDMAGYPGWNFELVVAHAIHPLTYIIGVTAENEERFLVSRLIAIKLTNNDLSAYLRLAEYLNANRLATYALCSWSNVVGAGTQVIFLSRLAPKRRALVSRIIWRALIAGNISCFMSACLAGWLFSMLSGKTILLILGIMISNPVVCYPKLANQVDCFNLTTAINLVSVLTAGTGGSNMTIGRAALSAANASNSFPLLKPLFATVNASIGHLGGEL